MMRDMSDARNVVMDALDEWDVAHGYGLGANFAVAERVFKMWSFETEDELRAKLFRKLDEMEASRTN